MKVELKGVAKVTSKGRTYYYAWRGGPRLRGEPGTPEFVASYNEAIETVAPRTLPVSSHWSRSTRPATITRSLPLRLARIGHLGLIA